MTAPKKRCAFVGPCGWQETRPPTQTRSWRVDEERGLGTVFRPIQDWARDHDLECVGYAINLIEHKGSAPWWEVRGQFRPAPLERETVYMNPATYTAQLAAGIITYTGPHQTARWHGLAIHVRDRYPDGVHITRPAL